jgi:hypothetical protein
MVAIPAGDLWRHLCLGELAHHGTEVFVILAELEHGIGLSSTLTISLGRYLTLT